MKPIKLSEIHLNDGTRGLPKNPRFIRDEKFKKLCDSVRDNPEFMPARPIIVDENGTILGGNMRYRACKEIGLKEVPSDWVQRVTGWSDEKKRRFIILDNRGFGEDDMDMLANEWDMEELIAAGFAEKDLGIFPESANDPQKEWEGMPGFENAPTPFATVHVHFKSKEDVDSFAAIIGQTVTERTKSIWHPIQNTQST